MNLSFVDADKHLKKTQGSMDTPSTISVLQSLHPFNHITTIDWLEMDFKATEYLLPQNYKITDDLSIEYIGSNSSDRYLNQAYSTHFLLKYCEYIVGSSSANPKDPKKDKQNCYVKIDNWVFYHPIFSALISEFHLLGVFQTNLLEFDSIKRVDIAFNTNENLCLKLKSYYDKIRLGEMKVLNHTNLSIQEKPLTADSPIYTMHNGLIVVYDKVLELKKSKKEYQATFFKNNGLVRDVYRCEISLDKEYCRKNNLRLELTKLNNQCYLNTIINNVIEKKATFRTNLTSNPSREQHFRLIEPISTGRKPIILQKFEPNARKVNSYDKNLIKNLSMAVSENESVLAIEVLQDFILNAPQSVADYFREFCFKSKVNPLNLNFEDAIGNKETEFDNNDDEQLIEVWSKTNEESLCWSIEEIRGEEATSDDESESWSIENSINNEIEYSEKDEKDN